MILPEVIIKATGTFTPPPKPTEGEAVEAEAKEREPERNARVYQQNDVEEMSLDFWCGAKN